MEATISASSTADSRYLAAKAAGAGFIVLLISTLLARVITALVISTSAPLLVWGVTADATRIREFTAALPAIAERTENAAFLVGPSVVFYGFSPKVFDARMREHSIDLRTYNVGFNANLPDLDALVVRRIGDAYNHAHRRVPVMMLTFETWAFNGGAFSVNPYRDRAKLVKKAALLTKTEVASLFLREPHYASEILGAWLLGGFGAPDSVALLGERMVGGPFNGAVSPSWWFGADPPAPDPYDQTLREARRGWGPQLGRWNESVRGEFFQDQGDDDAYTRLLSYAVNPSEKRVKATIDLFKGDVPVLPEWFVQFLEYVRFAQGFSDAVMVVITPTNPLVSRLTAQGYRHLEELKAEIRKTGASLIDLFEPPELTAADYIDLSHLNERTGKPIFSALLADRVADVLAHQKR